MEMTRSFDESVKVGQVIDSGEMSRDGKLYEEILLETSPNRVSARLSEIYAEALLDVATKQGKDKEVGDEFESLVHDVFDKSPDLETFFANPAVHRRRKTEVIDKSIAGNCSPLLEDFLKLLCKHDRMQLLRLVAISYQALRDKAAKRVRILVESAVRLDADQLERLRKILADDLHEEPILINRVRPELLGGVLLHVGDKVFDATVRYRLDTLRTQFLARGSHEIQTGRDRFSSNV